MAKRYIVNISDNGLVDPPDVERTAAATHASGTQIHLVNMGPTLGLQYVYSGSVNGTTTFYMVDNGVNGGRGQSAT